MNCKIGDFAVIVRANHEENVGAVVEILAEGVVGAEVPRPHWRVRARDRFLKITFERSGAVAHAREGYAYDSDLRQLDEVGSEISVHEEKVP